MWDTGVHDSLPVAYTAAGVHRALVLTDETEALVRAALNQISSVGLAPSPIVDLRGAFAGMDSTAIFAWSYERFYEQTSREVLVMLGGECGGESYKHGVADHGVGQGAFFMALSADPSKAPDEHALAAKVMAGQDDFSYVGALQTTSPCSTHRHATPRRAAPRRATPRRAPHLAARYTPPRHTPPRPTTRYLFGWHAYCKDTEALYTTLASQHTLRVEGLSTLPNFSFMHRKQLAPGFEFNNSHNQPTARKGHPHSYQHPHQHPHRGTSLDVEAKTYLACVQTDSLGLGAWLSPSRGTIPYAWETPLNYLLLAPVILEMYYGSATDMDLMIGAISGPGYNYPKVSGAAD